MAHLLLLEKELDRFQIAVSEPEKVALAFYCDELDRWNQKMNLTSLSDTALVRRLVAEPVWIACQLSLSGALVDVGSGNGSPSVPFHIVSHLRQSHLIEARARRAAFLRYVAGRLNLSNMTVHRGRFENIANTLEKPDWISLQAVALNEKLLAAIRTVAVRTTTVLWITSAETEPPLQPSRTLTVPMTTTQVHLFHLDLS